MKILFFAGLKDQTGTEEVVWEKDEATVGEVREYVLSLFPHAYTVKQAMAAVNEEFVQETDTVHADDTVAFLPPVSGG
ncbi:molybdopterin converting factor subunit 1 [Alkalicoccus urumqiensis]|nr:molybdopterin converting factor subunit 1 [Alkalicoccus urumqiensis]